MLVGDARARQPGESEPTSHLPTPCTPGSHRNVRDFYFGRYDRLCRPPRMPGDGGGEGPQLQGLAGDQSSSVTTQTHAASQHERVVPEGCLYHFSFTRADFLISCFLVAGSGIWVSILLLGPTDWKDGRYESLRPEASCQGPGAGGSGPHLPASQGEVPLVPSTNGS